MDTKLAQSLFFCLFSFPTIYLMLVPVDIGSISYVSYTNNTDDTPHTVKILR